MLIYQATSYPSYEFSYKISDPDTKDVKGQHEARDGDKVNGQYWLLQPNGYKRTVNYVANNHQGYLLYIFYNTLNDVFEIVCVELS